MHRSKSCDSCVNCLATVHANRVQLRCMVSEDDVSCGDICILYEPESGIDVVDAPRLHDALYCLHPDSGIANRTSYVHGLVAGLQATGLNFDSCIELIKSQLPIGLTPESVYEILPEAWKGSW